MATLHVQPRPTPEERADGDVVVEVDEAITVFVATIEDWITPRQAWEFTVHQGHDFGRANNVECKLLCISGDTSSSLSFRLDQLDAVEDTGASGELVLRFEERDGIAKFAVLTESALDVELFHVLTFT